MESQQKSTEAIDSITISYFADSYLNEEWDDMKWDIVEAISYVPANYDQVTTKTKAIVLNDDDHDFYFGVTLIYETPKDVVVYDVFEIDLNMFLEFVKEEEWIKMPEELLT
jgi:hypothetical protein